MTDKINQHIDDLNTAVYDEQHTHKASLSVNGHSLTIELDRNEYLEMVMRGVSDALDIIAINQEELTK